VTGESWNFIMKDCQISPPQCTDFNGPTTAGIGDTSLESAETVPGYYLMNDCGNSWLAVIYFITFYIMSNYTVLNLFIAVLLDSFAFCANVDHAEITAFHLEKFRSTWFKFTTNVDVNDIAKKTDGTTMSLFALHPFLEALGFPLGISVWNSEARDRYRLIQHEARAKLNKAKGGILYKDMLMILTAHALKWNDGQLPYDQYMEKKKTIVTLREEVSAKMLQAAYRGKKKREALGIKVAPVKSANERQAASFKAKFLQNLTSPGSAPTRADPMANNVSRGTAQPRPVQEIQMQTFGPGSPRQSMSNQTYTSPASPTSNPMYASPASPTSQNTAAAAVEITEVRNLFLERASKRKKAKELKGDLRGAGPSSSVPRI